MNAKVGDTISIRGRNFIRGKNKNTVVFKRDGARAVFAKETLGTAKHDPRRRAGHAAAVPEGERPRQGARARALPAFQQGLHARREVADITALPKPVETDSKTGTSTGSSTGGSSTTSGPTTPAPVCTGDQDGDFLSADRENALGLDACKADTDGDGVSDGYEYQAARDLNDDEYQETNSPCRTRASGPTRTRCSRTAASTTTATACG